MISTSRDELHRFVETTHISTLQSSWNTTYRRQTHNGLLPHAIQHPWRPDLALQYDCSRLSADQGDFRV